MWACKCMYPFVGGVGEDCSREDWSQIPGLHPQDFGWVTTNQTSVNATIHSSSNNSQTDNTNINWSLSFADPIYIVPTTPNVQLPDMATDQYMSR